MKIHIILLTMVTLLLSVASYGQDKLAPQQEEECGTVLTQEQADYMNKTRKQRAAIKQQLATQKASTISVPVMAHVLRRNDGTGGLTDAQLADALTTLNGGFEQLNMQFNICKVNYIDNTTKFNTYYTISNSAGSNEFNLAVGEKEDDKLNIFFVPSAQTSWSSFPVYEDLYDKDWIIMRNDHALNESTITHEVGHWFNLYHTHQGVSGTLGVTAKELVDGSNCGNNVGDELCDTPADPSLSGCVTAACAYTCSSTDTNGDTYAPDPTNLMSYSQKPCRTNFSSGQRTRMLISYYFDRTDLANDCNCADDIILAGTLESGTIRTYEAKKTINSTQVMESGAEITYQAGTRITLNPGFSVKLGAEFTAEDGSCSPAKTVVDNETTMTSRLGADGTGGALSESLTSYPNPFSGMTTISYELQAPAEINLTIYNTLGKRVGVLVNGSQSQGRQEVNFNADGLTPGIYYATLRVNGTVSTLKLAVNR